MKHLFVGDIHGDVEIVRNVLRFAADRHVVFLGDFLDSFRFSKQAQIEGLLAAMQAAQDGQATILLSNHELSYLDTTQRCSGWNSVMEAHVLPLQGELRRLLRPFVLFQGEEQRPLLLTHAGVTRQLWDSLGLTTNTLSSGLREASHDPRSWFYSCGRYRGGLRPHGGPLWCDWNNEFVPVPEISQIVGHSCTVGVPYGFRQKLLSGIRYSDNLDFNIDCLQETPEILEYDEDDGSVAVFLVNDAGIHQLSAPMDLSVSRNA